eukprot:gene10591-14228_t
MQPLYYALIATTIISVLPNLLLVFIPSKLLSRTDSTNRKANFQNILLCFSSGGLLGDVFLHTLPHLLGLHSHHDHESGDSHNHSHKKKMETLDSVKNELQTCIETEKGGERNYCVNQNNVHDHHNNKQPHHHHNHIHHTHAQHKHDLDEDDHDHQHVHDDAFHEHEHNHKHVKVDHKHHHHDSNHNHQDDHHHKHDLDKVGFDHDHHDEHDLDEVERQHNDHDHEHHNKHSPDEVEHDDHLDHDHDHQNNHGSDEVEHDHNEDASKIQDHDHDNSHHTHNHDHSNNNLDYYDSHNLDKMIIIPLIVLLGFLIFMIAEKVTTNLLEHKHEHNHKKHDDNQKSNNKTSFFGALLNIKSSGWLNLVADSMHNFTDGIAIGAAFAAAGEGTTSGFQGLAVAKFISVIFHEIPHEIGDFTILMQNGLSKKDAIKAQFLTAIAALIGTVVGSFAIHNQMLQDLLLALTSGGFLYIATVSVLPSIASCPSTIIQIILESISFVAGVGMMVVVALYE